MRSNQEIEKLRPRQAFLEDLATYINKIYGKDFVILLKEQNRIVV